MTRFPYGVLTSVMPNGGGWRFPYPEEYAPKDGDAFIRAATFEALVRKVSTFRIEAGLRLGDTEFEVAEYIKQVSPPNDRFKGRRTYEPRPEGREDYRPPIVRITEWLVGMGRRRDLRLVNEFDASDRVPACETCVHNIKWRTNCEPCNENVEFRGKILRGTPIFEHDNKLGACRVHDVLLNAAVFLDRDHLPDRHIDAPANCFMPQR